MGIAIPNAVAQTAKDLIGTWTLNRITARLRTAGRFSRSARDPRGIAIFYSNDRFAIVASRHDLPKFASNNRMHGTAEENEAIVHGSIAFFGTFSVTDGVIIQHVEGGTWPAWIGTDQKRTITSFTPDEQTWTTVPSFGGRSELHWKRVK